MDDSPILATPRLLLRRLRPDDATALSAYRSRPEVSRYQSWESFGQADAEKLIADQSGIEPDSPGKWIQLALVLADTVIGDCGIHFLIHDPRQVELGITLAPNYWGRGLAAEALRGVLGYLFDTLGKHRVSAVTDDENRKAADLFRRLGFRQETHLVEQIWFKGAWGSEFTFAMLRSEWRCENRNV